MERLHDHGTSSHLEGHDQDPILAASCFRGLPPESRDVLGRLGVVTQLPRHHVLATQGKAPTNFLLIGSGRVKLERIRCDRTLVLEHRGPGQMVGESALGSEAAATEHASVVEQVKGFAIPFVALRGRLAEDAALHDAMAAALVQQQRALEKRLMGLLLHEVPTRLVAFLLDAGARWGVPHPLGQLIAASFTHLEIAQLIGSTRETVTLLLGKLKRKDLLAFDCRRAIIRDRVRLAERLATPAGGSPPADEAVATRSAAGAPQTPR